MYTLGRKLSFYWKVWLGWILVTLAGIQLCVLCLYHLVRYVLIDELLAIELTTTLTASESATELQEPTEN